MIPRISTRGFYDLWDGHTLKKTTPYRLYPRQKFESLTCGKKEVTVVLHGMRNDCAGAVKKFEIAKRRFCSLGYGYPVVGFSYDANVRGVSLASGATRALAVAQRIAKKNGVNLARFILDFKKQNPRTKLRLVGHSLGSVVILHCVQRLAAASKTTTIGRRTLGKQIESVHFAGGSVNEDQIMASLESFDMVVSSKVVNYYGGCDDVLEDAHLSGQVVNPIGYTGYDARGYEVRHIQKKVCPKSHRFASYAAIFKSFP